MGKRKGKSGSNSKPKVATSKRKAISTLTMMRRLRIALDHVLSEYRSHLYEQFRGWDDAESGRPASEVRYEYIREEVERMLNGKA